MPSVSESIPALATQRLSKIYSRGWLAALLGRGSHRSYALREVEIQVPQGATVGLLGPNGAGKTTLLKCLLGLLHPSEGSCTLLGESSLGWNAPQARRRVGALISKPAFPGHLSGRRNLDHLCWLHQVPTERADQALKTVGLDYAGDSLVSSYSTGMLQRLGIAASLLNDPAIWILDEPTNGLDPTGIREIRALIEARSQDPGRTILVSSHHLQEIESLCDYVVVLKEGTVLSQGPVRDLLSDETLRQRLILEPHPKLEAYLLGHPSIEELLTKLPQEDGNLEFEVRLRPEDRAKLHHDLIQQGFQILASIPRPKGLEEYFLETIAEGTRDEVED